MVTLVELYFFFKSSGIVLSITYLEGQILTWPNFRTMKLIQVIKIQLTVDTEIWKRWPRCSSRKPCLLLHITRKYSSSGFRVFFLPLLLSFLPFSRLSNDALCFESQYFIFSPEGPRFKYPNTAINAFQFGNPV